MKHADRRPATRAEARALAPTMRLRVLRLCLDEALTNRDLADRLSERVRLAEFSVNQVLVKDLRPVPAVCVIGRP